MQRLQQPARQQIIADWSQLTSYMQQQVQCHYSQVISYFTVGNLISPPSMAEIKYNKTGSLYGCNENNVNGPVACESTSIMNLQFYIVYSHNVAFQLSASISVHIIHWLLSKFNLVSVISQWKCSCLIISQHLFTCTYMQSPVTNFDKIILDTFYPRPCSHGLGPRVLQRPE